MRVVWTILAVLLLLVGMYLFGADPSIYYGY